MKVLKNGSVECIDKPFILTSNAESSLVDVYVELELPSGTKYHSHAVYNEDGSEVGSLYLNGRVRLPIMHTGENFLEVCVEVVDIDLYSNTNRKVSAQGSILQSEVSLENNVSERCLKGFICKDFEPCFNETQTELSPLEYEDGVLKVTYIGEDGVPQEQTVEVNGGGGSTTVNKETLVTSDDDSVTVTPSVQGNVNVFDLSIGDIGGNNNSGFDGDYLRPYKDVIPAGESDSKVRVPDTTGIDPNADPAILTEFEDCSQLFAPQVIEHDGMYMLYYSGNTQKIVGNTSTADFSRIDRIFLAYKPVSEPLENYNWQKWDGGRTGVIDISGLDSGKLDAGNCWLRTVFKQDDGLIVCLYSGDSVRTNTAHVHNAMIAISLDGINWDKEGHCTGIPSTTSYYLYKKDSIYYMYVKNSTGGISLYKANSVFGGGNWTIVPGNFMPGLRGVYSIIEDDGTLYISGMINGSSDEVISYSVDTALIETDSSYQSLGVFFTANIDYNEHQTISGISAPHHTALPNGTNEWIVFYTYYKSWFARSPYVPESGLRHFRYKNATPYVNTNDLVTSTVPTVPLPTNNNLTGLNANLLNYYGSLMNVYKNEMLDYLGNNDMKSSFALSTTPALFGDGFDINTLNDQSKQVDYNNSDTFEEFTYNCWLKVRSFNGSPNQYGVIFSFDNATGTWNLYPSGYMLFDPDTSTSSSSYRITTATSVWDPYDWQMLTLLVSKSNNYIKLLVNGTQVGSQLWDGAIDFTDITYFQKYPDNPSKNHGQFDGIVNQIAIWNNRILTTSDITTLYNSGNGLPFEDF